MPKHDYLTSPDQSRTNMPPGVPYIVGNEAAERFSFYGMKGILVIFMTQHLLNAAGEPTYYTEEGAKAIYHLFSASAYFFPLIGAMIADIWLGKYKTILFISLMYCLGHGLLALMDVGPHTGLWDMKPFMFAGLICIAIGAGGIKPCVSAHVGDQFGTGNKRLLTQVFNWFYFSINLGAAASTLLTPVLLARVGPWAAFGVPGVLMAIATFVFWLGRNKFVHVPPAGLVQWKRETFSLAGRRALINLIPLFLVFVPMFWMIFDQSGSAWVLQGDKMNRNLGFTWLPSQIQAINPLFILTGIPIFTYVVYPIMGKLFKVTPLRKIGIGFCLTALAFAVSAVIETAIVDREQTVAQAMYVDLATDAAASTPDVAVSANGEESESKRMIWSRAAVSAAQVTGWKDHAIAETLGLAEDGESRQSVLERVPELDGQPEKLLAQQLKYRLEESRKPFASAQVSHLFRVLADPGDSGLREGTLNGAVIGARNAKWDETRVVGYLQQMPNIIWQFLAYLILTCAEILVSIVSLEFAYTQSPPKMKSFIMGVYFLGVSLGNFYIAGVNIVMEAMRSDNGQTPLEGANYYWFFVAIMGINFLVYLLWARTYKGRTYIQGEDEPIEDAQADAYGPDAR